MKIDDGQKKILEEHGWILDFQNPLEIHSVGDSGSKAIGYAAEYIVSDIMDDELKSNGCRCFRCEKKIDSACGGGYNLKDEKFVPGDPWETPCGGVVFDGGWNFGSRLYDALVPSPDNVYVRIVVCDECLEFRKGSDYLKEIFQKSPSIS